MRSINNKNQSYIYILWFCMFIATGAFGQNQGEEDGGLAGPAAGNLENSGPKDLAMATAAEATKADSVDVTVVDSGDRILKTPFGTFNLSQTAGSVYIVSGDELRKTPGNNISEALRGRVPGLRITRGTNTPSSDGGYSYQLNGGTPFILIDGQPRGLQVDLREVEEVLVLSDATFNSLLGILGDNGLIYIVTKSGKTEKATVEVNYQYGINKPTRMPRLLNAHEYATVVNRAANNDGLGDVYSQEALDAYRNGTDPILFPNVNFQDEFLRNSAPSHNASLGVFGGNENTVYSAFLGYSDWQGLEKIGKRIDGRDITFRTKIRAQLSDLLSTHASVYGRFGENERPVIGADQMFDWITSTPANAFPLTVGDTAYIVSNQFDTNVLAELQDGGTRTDSDANMFFDFGFDFDFSESVPGLGYQTYLLLRTFNSQSLQANNAPGTYTIEVLQDQGGDDSLALKVNTVELRQLNVVRNNSGIARNFTYGGNLSYLKNIGQGKLNLNLNHLLYFIPTRIASEPDIRNLTFNLNASYAYNDKYIAYANLNSSSSSKFLGDNRSVLFPTFGAAWVLSKESFLEGSRVINFLKVRGSYGQIGTEYTASSFFYLDTWAGGRNNNTLYTGVANTVQNDFGFRVSQIGNRDIDWVRYNQFFAGVDMRILDRLSATLNYFNIEIDGQVTKAGELFSDALGNDNYLPNINYTIRRNEGLNAALTYNGNAGEFRYYVNANLGYSKKILKKLPEVQHLDAYRLQVGRADDLIMGYESDGLFTAENIGDALPQFGELQVGDIKYKDQNGDNVIDSRDQVEIGNSTPRINYGVSIGASYKGFNIDVVGTGTGGYDLNLANIAYYKHSGLETYYGSVNSDLPNGNANPRLSTLESDNNFRTSDYWLVNGGYFRISFAELGYSLPESMISGIRIDRAKIFLRGSNLAVFSELKDLDPEDTRSGIFEYPMMRNFTVGASVSF